MSCRWLGGKACAVEDWIHEVTRAIARERPSRAIGPMCSRCKAQDQDLSVHIAETWHRLGPVVPTQIGTTLLSSYLLTIRDQPFAAYATDHILVQDFELGEDRTHSTTSKCPISASFSVKASKAASSSR